MKDSLDGLDDLTLLALAVVSLGGVDPVVISKKQIPALQKAARKIALRELARLANGEEIHPRMKRLAAVWAGSQLNGRGRPKLPLRDEAIQAAFLQKQKLEPQRKTESIVEELKAAFGLSRSQINKILAIRDGDIE